MVFPSEEGESEKETIIFIGIQAAGKRLQVHPDTLRTGRKFFMCWLTR